MKEDLGEGAWILLVQDFLPDHLALMEKLRASLPLGPERLRFFGRDVTAPRLTSWHGDPGTSYRYSGRTFDPLPWTDELSALKRRVDNVAGIAFNSVLVNYYRDGRDAMGEHSDNEPELGPARDNILIASVSLGETRRFLLRHKRRKAVREILLGGGNLLLMGGTIQRHFSHRVPPSVAARSPRMNLTFRVVTIGRASVQQES
jgi:alkylated DNA repair dioxygenase AlkB